MAQVEAIDETFVVAPPHRVAAVVAAQWQWPRWWPDLRLHVAEDRGAEGARWRVSGAWTGTSEIWIEPCADGCVAHYYLRIDRAGRRLSGRRARREVRRRRVRGRQVAWAIKDALESGRTVGMPP